MTAAWKAEKRAEKKRGRQNKVSYKGCWESVGFRDSKPRRFVEKSKLTSTQLGRFNPDRQDDGLNQTQSGLFFSLPVIYVAFGAEIRTWKQTADAFCSSNAHLIQKQDFRLHVELQVCSLCRCSSHLVHPSWRLDFCIGSLQVKMTLSKAQNLHPSPKSAGVSKGFWLFKHCIFQRKSCVYFGRGQELYSGETRMWFK